MPSVSNYIVDARRVVVLFCKELSLILRQPATYVASVFLTAGSAALFFFGSQFFVPGRGTSDMRFFFSTIPYLSILVVPSLTMGQWDSGTVLFDQTLPVSDGQVVFAKWLASMCVSVAMLVPGIVVPVCVSLFGNVELAQILSGYVGISCFLSAACSLGVLLSALCGGRVAAFLVTSIVLAMMCLVHLVPAFAELPQWLSALCRQLSFSWHFDAAGKGIVDTRDLVFYAVVSVACLLVAAEVLRARKRG